MQFERGSYIPVENVGSQEICVVAVSGTPGIPVSLMIYADSAAAAGKFSVTLKEG